MVESESDADGGMIGPELLLRSFKLLLHLKYRRGAIGVLTDMFDEQSKVEDEIKTLKALGHEDELVDFGRSFCDHLREQMMEMLEDSDGKAYTTLWQLFRENNAEAFDELVCRLVDDLIERNRVGD